MCQILFLRKMQKFWPTVYQKETPTQAFSSKYFKAFKNIYLEEHLQAAASAALLILILT